VIQEVGIAVGAFLLGVVVVVWSTDRLLAGMVGLATLLRLAPFAIAGIFSGLEAENVAVGLVAAHGGVAALALGTVFWASPVEDARITKLARADALQWAARVGERQSLQCLQHQLLRHQTTGTIVIQDAAATWACGRAFRGHVGTLLTTIERLAFGPDGGGVSMRHTPDGPCTTGGERVAKVASQ